jgi:hypothetical protein
MVKISQYLKYIDFISAKIPDRIIFTLFAFVGATTSLILRPHLNDFRYQFGIETIGFFVPPFLTGSYMAICGFRNGFSKKLLFTTILIFLLQIVPFGGTLFQAILPNPGEDFARNFAYAQNMITQRTLWGGDKIAYPDEGYAFITQPGHRYFIAFELIIFKDLYRFVGLINILIFIVSLFFFMKSIVLTLGKSLFTGVLLFFLAMTVPYAVKNILMGLNEWLMVILLMLGIYFQKVRKSVILAIIFLALVPFVRQNTLPSVILIAGWIVVGSKNKLLVAVFFLVILMLPLYHNLYYAGEWRFFASIHQWPFLYYSTPSKYEPAIGVNYMKVINNVLHYAGIHVKGDKSIDLIEEACCFLWMFPGVFFYIQKKYFFGFKRLYFLIIAFGMIIPTFFIATHFYPRFEFVCIYITLAAFVSLQGRVSANPVFT